jgi:Fe-S cluster assembly protein SufD
MSPQRFLTNAVSEVYAGENSSFDLIRVQNEHNNACKITHTFVHQERNSHVTSSIITLHGGLVRNNTFHRLNGEGADCNSYGLFLADKWQHVDNFVSVDHHRPTAQAPSFSRACSMTCRLAHSTEGYMLPPTPRGPLPIRRTTTYC